MRTPLAKHEVAFLLAMLLERGRGYTAAELDAMLRDAVRADLFNDPRCSPDHIRVYLVERRALVHDPRSGSYRVDPDFVLLSEYRQTYDDLYQAAQVAKPTDWKQCPICGYEATVRSLPGHFVIFHERQGQKIDQIIDEYGR